MPSSDGTKGPICLSPSAASPYVDPSNGTLIPSICVSLHLPAPPDSEAALWARSSAPFLQPPWFRWSVGDILYPTFSKLSHMSAFKAVQSTDFSSATQPNRGFLGAPSLLWAQVV